MFRIHNVIVYHPWWIQAAVPRIQYLITIDMNSAIKGMLLYSRGYLIYLYSMLTY